MRKSLESSGTRRVALGAALAALCALAAFGQSGRRVRKPDPPPVPVAEPTPTPGVPAEKTKPMLTFIVGMDKFGDFSGIPLGTATSVLRACTNRLDEPETVKADTSSQDMGRGDAVLRAKSEKEAYVVWLKLRPNDISGRAGSADEVYIEYSVFAPTTGKQTASGRIFPGASGNRGVIVPNSTGVYGDYYLIQAAKDTADKILADFHVR